MSFVNLSSFYRVTTGLKQCWDQHERSEHGYGDSAAHPRKAQRRQPALKVRQKYPACLPSDVDGGRGVDRGVSTIYLVLYQKVYRHWRNTHKDDFRNIGRLELDFKNNLS